MRHLERLPKPEILVKKEKEWTDKFIESGKERPDNSKYAHKDIVADLNAISFYKCYYSEQKLKGVSREIDHHIEVSERKELAYVWDNLYLSSTECNNKIPNKTIPVTAVLDPFIHSDQEIEAHLNFEDDIIIPKNSSELGLKTIKKYRLDSPLLDSLRSKQLLFFYKVLNAIKDKQIEEGRNFLTNLEKENLTRFADSDYSFSLMFRVLLKKHGLLNG